MMFRRTAVASALGALALSLVSIGAAVAQTTVTSPVQISHRVTSDWGAGFCGEIIVRNTSAAPTDGWSGSFTLPNAKVNQVWNATWSQSGNTVTVSAMGWNKTIPANGSISAPGFCAVKSGTADSASSLSSSSAASSSAASVASSSSSSASAAFVAGWNAFALRATAGPQGVTLQWPARNAGRVEIYRDTDANPRGRVRIAIPENSASTYLDRTVGSNTTYYYWIKQTVNGVVANSSLAFATSGQSGTGQSSSSASSVSSSSASSSISSSSSSVSSSSASSSVSSSAASSSSQSSASSSAAAYTAVTTQYVHDNISPSNALYMDSAHFRVYYGGSGKTGGGLLGTHTTAQVTQVLDYLETAYDYWMVQRGFRSPGLPVAGRSGGPFKINVYIKANIDAGGFMGYDSRAGLSFVIVNSNSISGPNVYVHEFGHSITLSEYLWVDKAVTGAWWEVAAQWHTDDYLAFSPQYAAAAARHGRATSNTIIDLNTVIGRSHLTLVHANNLYQAWPFFSYLNANPDGYSGLGINAIRTLYRSHQGSQTETPLHTIARMVSSTTWQRVVGSYWARMAYMDIKHPLAQQRLMASINNASFRASAYRNLSAAGTNTYRVITARQPMYGGANINPLTVTGGSVGITVRNLGNGLADSNFTATLAIRNTANGSVRYVQLPNGVGSASVASGEEVSLVVANTPNNLYTYNAFESTATSPDRIGLNYEVVMTGARPRDL